MATISFLAHLTANPEIINPRGGQSILHLRAVENFYGQDANGCTELGKIFYNISVFNSYKIPKISQLQKGDCVQITGDFRVREYVTQTGQPGQSFDVIAHDVHLVVKERDYQGYRSISGQQFAQANQYNNGGQGFPPVKQVNKNQPQAVHSTVQYYQQQQKAMNGGFPQQPQPMQQPMQQAVQQPRPPQPPQAPQPMQQQPIAQQPQAVQTTTSQHNQTPQTQKTQKPQAKAKETATDKPQDAIPF